MSENELKKIVKDLIARKHEEEWFEFKVNWEEIRTLGEYISALSNAATMHGRDYGYFVWGIENDTHEVIGTKFDFYQDVKNEPLQHYLARQVKPDIGFRFEEIRINRKRIVVLTIPAARKSPTAFDRERYLRIGSSKVNLMDYPERESQLFNILRNGMPTIENTESEYQDLTFDKLFMYYKMRDVPINSRTFKKNLGLLTSDGKYNLMAQLVSDNSHIPIRFSGFSGETKASTMYYVREYGNDCLLVSLDKILDFGDVLNVPQADEANRKTTRIEIPLFDKEVYKEAVVNALLHNKWIDYNAPMFTVYSNRIEILSRGTMPPRQTVEGFFMGESVPVNQRLSDMFLQLHISERSGQGVPSIVDVYGKEAYVFRDNSIVVNIPFERLETNFSDNMTAWGVPKDNEKPDSGEVDIGAEKMEIDYQNPNIEERNPNIEERNPNIGEGNPNIGERNPNIGERNPNIEELKLVYERMMSEKQMRKGSVEKVFKMLDQFGIKRVFGRDEVIRVLGGAPTATSAFLQNLLELNITVAISGQGKGKYRFNPLADETDRR